MKELCIDFFEELNRQIANCVTCYQTDEGRIECCFIASEMAWTKLRGELQFYRFGTNQEEIWFFKTMKPQFTGLIEFFTLLYRAALFAPAEEMAITRYWERELKGVQDFFTNHASFYDYYKSTGTHLDSLYFLREAFKPDQYKFTKLYDIGSDMITSHDHLVASIIAREKFQEYILRRLQKN
jgi:hypothetical protein